MKIYEKVKEELNKLKNNEKEKILKKFFKTGAGEYGEGDIFLGITVPEQRKISKKYYNIISLEEVEKLLKSDIHEYRMTSLLILILKYEKTQDITEKENIINLYLNNIEYINNWDLVDLSSPKLLGDFLFNYKKDFSILYEFAKSNNLWKKRISIISTYYFIKNNQLNDTLNIVTILLSDSNDLIHKACGWMLRETGKIDKQLLINFLDKNYNNLPRTTLRYAIEKFDNNLRNKYLNKFYTENLLKNPGF